MCWASLEYILAQDLPKAVTAQNSLLKQWPYFANGLIILQTALNLLAMPPVSTLQPVF